ncbi:MAG: hypothetical protein LIP09_06160 [Bacteroidales bacterium]|nr:hypothetical protein [Bacteroidales bacterium]
MCDPGARALLRRALLETYFPQSLPESAAGFASIAANPDDNTYGFINKTQSLIRA